MFICSACHAAGRFISGDSALDFSVDVVGPPSIFGGTASLMLGKRQAADMLRCEVLAFEASDGDFSDEREPGAAVVTMMGITFIYCYLFCSSNTVKVRRRLAGTRAPHVLCLHATRYRLILPALRNIFLHFES